ncbi:MAG: glycosyltransferase [Sinomonas sp.]|nr:glycosyltransferase [Sinomonas sp.]
MSGGIVVLSAANRWDGVRMADQQLAASLSRLVPVLYVDPPESAATRVRSAGWGSAVRRGGLVELGPRLWRLTPEGLPGLSRPGIRAINAEWVAQQVRRATARLGAAVVASLEANVLVPVSGRIGEAITVYWAQDDFVGMAPLVGGSAAAYARANERLAANSDLVIAANPHVAAALTARGAKPLTIPFGCDAPHFAAAEERSPAEDIGGSRPRAVFMGHLGDRIDVALLERLADDGVCLLMVGPRHLRADFSRFDALLAKPGVQWVGGRDFDLLPDYLAGADVGLVPYTQSRFNVGSFPLKTLEYLAAGLPVVSTTLPGVEWIASEDIHFADDAESFSRSVRAVLAAGRSGEAARRRRDLASKHSWDERARAFAEAIGLVQHTRTPMQEGPGLGSPFGREKEP